jgi:hypothetical protein
MVYASPIDLSNEDSLSVLGGPDTAKSPVRVYYRGVALDSIAGPVPFVDLSISYNNTEAGIPLSVTTKATINGKIVRTTGMDPDVDTYPGSGVKTVISAIKAMQNLFSCNDGDFQLKCGTVSVLDSSGVVKVNSFSAKPSDNNWVYSSDYTIELEFYEPPVTGAQSSDYPLVKEASDSWSLESLENYQYMDASISNIKPYQKAEIHNPQLNLPQSAPDQLKFVTLPRFKLSRKVSGSHTPGSH